MLGADGGWIGTRLVATDESAAHDGYKARLVASAATATVRTAIFGPETPDFNPMRVLRNRVVDQWADRPTGDARRPVIGHTDLGGGDVEMRRFSNLVPMRDRTTGDLEEMALLAGQGVGLVDSVKGAAEVIADLNARAGGMLGRYRGLR